jgi:monofunctional glycosyltransferase
MLSLPSGPDMAADWYSQPPSGGRSWDYGPTPAASARGWQPPQQPPSNRPPRRRVLRSLGRFLAYLVMLFLCLDLAAETYFICLNWVNPPITMYMLEGGGEHLHDYVSLRYVSRYMVAATIAHEDAQLPTRFTGLDWDQWWNRVTAYIHHRKDPSGSPIPEQLSKNLLLWPSRNPIRKTLDAVLAEQLVHAVSRQRVLELYLNEAQFGPNIYGICDAAWYYFNDPPDYMSLKDAYELMGVLPGPDHAHRLRTGGIDISRSTSDGRFERYYIQGAEYWVPRDLQVDGGSDDVYKDVTTLTREMGIPGTAYGQPGGPGDCRTEPPDIRQLKASEQQ